MDLKFRSHLCVNTLSLLTKNAANLNISVSEKIPICPSVRASVRFEDALNWYRKVIECGLQKFPS
jgi:hypothetical protein